MIDSTWLAPLLESLGPEERPRMKEQTLLYEKASVWVAAQEGAGMRPSQEILRKGLTVPMMHRALLAARQGAAGQVCEEDLARGFFAHHAAALLVSANEAKKEIRSVQQVLTEAAPCPELAEALQKVGTDLRAHTAAFLTLQEDVARVTGHTIAWLDELLLGAYQDIFGNLDYGFRGRDGNAWVDGYLFERLQASIAQGLFEGMMGGTGSEGAQMARLKR